MRAILCAGAGTCGMGVPRGEGGGALSPGDTPPRRPCCQGTHPKRDFVAMGTHTLVTSGEASLKKGGTL